MTVGVTHGISKEIAHFICELFGFQRVSSSQAFQRVSWCPETPPQASQFLGHDEEESWHQDSSSEQESEAEESDVDGTFAQALSPSGSRALYWMVVLCKRAGGTPTQTHPNFVKSPSNEGGKERMWGVDKRAV